jgi:hypothetical protein
MTGKAMIAGKLRRPFIAISVALSIVGCKHDEPSRFIVVRADHQISSASKYPVAIDPIRVGTYPPSVKSGAGYFYDDVLEYRVWLHPENGAKPLNGDNDYFVAFAQFETAQALSESTPGAEPPLVLIRQREWIDEPKKGQFIRRNGERITEWQVQWLKDNKRNDHSIDEFLKHPREAYQE